MTTEMALTADIECPLCLGNGQLKRSEVLERLGIKGDFARIAQLSAEEALRLVLNKEKDAEQVRWGKFESELVRRTKELTDKFQTEIQALKGEKSHVEIQLQQVEKNQSTILDNAKQSERLQTETQLRKQMSQMDGQIKDLEAKQKLSEGRQALEVEKVRVELQSHLDSERSKSQDLNRKVQDYFEQMSKLQTRNQELEKEMQKVARIGRKEEIGFAEEARTWPGIWISEKLKKHGDYILAFSDASGAALDPKMVLDNKAKESQIVELDIEKLIRDAKEQRTPVAIIVTQDEDQLRRLDRDHRWGMKDGVWILRTTRQWLPRDLEVLKPLFERMRVEGPEFLNKNVALSHEICRTFEDMDELERELKKAGIAIDKAKILTANYRIRLQALCDSSHPEKIKPQSALDIQDGGAKAGD